MSRPVTVKKKSGPLTGLRVLDTTRLAPGPYCSMLLADLGAEVIVIGGGRGSTPIPEFSRGKRFINLNLKSASGQKALHLLAKTADVFLEGFRPGVSDKIGCGYRDLSAVNERLIYCSLTGYGQQGPRATDAGHDVNYIALTGVLGAIGPADREPPVPLNLVADFAGGSLVAAMGILAAVVERNASGKGQFIDSAMTDGCLSLMAMQFPLWKTPLIPSRGKGLFGEAPFYRCYPCADGKYVSVGALERPFFVALWTGMGFGDVPDHMNTALWPEIERRLAEAFRSRPRDDWDKKFLGTDACVVSVLDPDEVAKDPQFIARYGEKPDDIVPVVPRFERTPGVAGEFDQRDQSREILEELGLDSKSIEEAITKDPVGTLTGIAWPPQFT